MKFNIFGKWELIYKKIIYLLIVFITVVTICLYFQFTSDKRSDIAYIFSIAYALFLFIMGVYDNYKKNKIDEKFYERKDYYLNLLKLKELFGTVNFESYSDEDVSTSIIAFKVFTSRHEDTKTIKPYILQQGFEFSDKELIIEDKFFEMREKLIEKLQKEIIQYIDKNSIDKKHLNPRVDEVFFDVETWCIDNTALSNEDLKDMENYIYKLFSEIQEELDEFKVIITEVLKKYKSYKLDLEWNIKKIEKIYGQKLRYEILKDDIYISEIVPIRQLLEEIKINTSNENLSDSISEIKDDIQSAHDKIRFDLEEISALIDHIKGDAY